MNSFHFPTSESYATSNIQSIENVDDTQPDCYFISFPMNCFVPCPSSLSELKGSDHASSENKGSWIMALFLMLVGIVENDFYFSKDNKNDGENNNSVLEEVDNGDDGDNKRGCRVYMEYIINENTTIDDDMTNVSLIDCVGIRFCFAIYGRDTRPSDAFGRLFKNIAKEKTKKKRGGSNYRGNGFVLPSILQYDQIIQDWMIYIQAASAYMGVIDESAITNVARDGCPLFHNPVEVCSLLSHKTSIDVIEAQSGVKVDPRQKADILDVGIDEPIKFGIPGLVYKFLDHWINRVAMLYVTLPRSSSWRLRSRENQIACNVGLTSVRTLDSSYTESFFKSMRYKQENKNDLKDLGIMMNKRIAAINCIGNVYERVVKKKLYRKDSVKRAQRIWDTNAHISGTIKNIILWTEQHDTWTTPPEYQRVVDNHSLSSFGNMVAREFYCYEFDMSTFTNHDIMFFIMVCAHNAYQYKLESLHLNLILLGAGSTGKSFMLNLLNKLLIEGTTETLSNITEKAFALGENKNDHISLFHELPQQLLTTNGRAGSGDTGDTIFKDLLTKGSVVTIQPKVTDDNERIELKFESERVGVFICATNEREDRMHESLHSRFVPITVNERQRTGCSMLDKQTSPVRIEEIDTTSYTEINQKGLLHRTRTRQAMVAMVERAIYIGLLDEPDISIAQRGVVKAVKVITQHLMPGISYNNREISNIVLFARTLTIMHACERFANDTTSPGYNKAFSFENLLPIQDYLMCTEEIAVFALSYFFERLLKGNTIRTMLVLLNTIKSTLVTDGETNFPVSSEDGYYYTTQVHRSRPTLYRQMKTTTIEQTVSGEEKLSAENMQVCFNQLINMSYSGKNILIHTQDTGKIQVNSAYVDENFMLDPVDNLYKSKMNFMETFKYVVKQAFSHKAQEPSLNCILSFVRDIKYPFILDTMDLGVDKMDKYMEISDFSSELNEQVEVMNVRGDQIIKQGACYTYMVDMQDLSYTEYFNSHNEHDPEDYNLKNSREKLSTMHNPATCSFIVPTPEYGAVHKYPESMIYAYNRVYKKRLNSDQTQRQSKRARLEDDDDDE